MGGRIASQVIAGEDKESFIDAVAGLVFLGYPLHPPGQSTKLRVEHLEHVGKPMLFVQGTRDALGTPDEIHPYIKNLRPAASRLCHNPKNLIGVMLIIMKAMYSVAAVVKMTDRGGDQLWKTSHWTFTKNTPGHG